MAEQKLLQSVIHPNICRLLAISADGPQRCLVLELCPTGSLYGVLKKDRAAQKAADLILGWPQRVQIAVAIARALVHLHMQSPPMIHRDVKTQNVLLTTINREDMISATKVYLSTTMATVRSLVMHRWPISELCGKMFVRKRTWRRQLAPTTKRATQVQRM